MERHDAEAAERFPGPDYRQALEWLHEVVKPQVYVELGVHCGDSLRLASDAQIAIGVDPAAAITQTVPGNARVFPMTSDDFFQREVLTGLCGSRPIDLAFIDGLHLFEQVMRDIHGLERHAGPDTILAVHDTIPLNAETSERVRRTEFHTGDVWKAVACLHAHRPELRMLTLTAAPTGLTLIRGFGASPLTPKPDERVLRAFIDMDWAHFQTHSGQFLQLAPNRRSTIQSFCQ
ncbi:MAG: class I SAM-dependent methyltransferase [Acidobacteria bacterium]|nr:class I SAM-dependent methyltransferase [Acidobacteriota bacterium]